MRRAGVAEADVLRSGISLLLRRWRLRRPSHRQGTASGARYREIRADRRPEFLAKGTHGRHFFPHRLYFIPRAGPDGVKLAEWIYDGVDVRRTGQVLMFAIDEALDGLPEALFFDPDLVWHQQQLGLPGHVGCASVVFDGADLLTTARFSDVVQRLSRQRDWASTLERRFRGWDLMMLNGILALAVERGCTRIHFPTAATAMRHTDEKRTVRPELFERIYDLNIARSFEARRLEDRWVVDVRRNTQRLVCPRSGFQALADWPTVCICHDIERELGHVAAEPAFVDTARRVAGENLERMLEIEERHGVRGTYNVVGCLMDELRPEIEKHGHEIAFHSYDHGATEHQLRRCRHVDYRLRGYRVPRSRLGPELSTYRLARRNFEWLASSASSLSRTEPWLDGGVVRVPIHFDDFPVHTRAHGAEEWWRRSLEKVRGAGFVALGLHDCYAQDWLPRYDRMLDELATLGTLETVGQLADRVFLQQSL